MSDGDKWVLGCGAVAVLTVAVVGFAGYGVWSAWDRAASQETCRTLIVETPRGETRYLSTTSARISYELDGERLTAQLPSGTLPESGRVVITDVRRVQCSEVDAPDPDEAELFLPEP